MQKSYSMKISNRDLHFLRNELAKIASNYSVEKMGHYICIEFENEEILRIGTNAVNERSVHFNGFNAYPAYAVGIVIDALKVVFKWDHLKSMEVAK